LPEFGQYALSVFFFDKKSSETAIADFEKVASNYNLKVNTHFLNIFDI
jgi:hypothetical protein